MKVHSYWGLLKTDGGALIRVTVQAENSYFAQQMMKGQHGERLVTQSASFDASEDRVG